MTQTFFWHDYETFGINPRVDRPAQFAGIRTDMDLNPIGKPVMLYCRPGPDHLPDPMSCLITGITPQKTANHGIPENEFFQHIHAALAQSGTIGVGYNTLRFDDEVTRHGFWRNLIDPYGREWQHGCGRWDILDCVRTTWALRPEGLQWPQHEDGKPSFRLEQLTQANDISHGHAHDALSDVEATIALARLLKTHQPRLFDYCLQLRRKDAVIEQLQLGQQKPFLHISGMFPTDKGCMAIMYPLGWHPRNKNELIAWDLAHDPAELATLTIEEAQQRLYTKTADLPEGVKRLPIKTIHINRSPVVIGNLKTLTPDLAERYGHSVDMALAHAHWFTSAPDLAPLLEGLFYRATQEIATDVEADLYGGFIGNRDRTRLDRLNKLDGLALQAEHPSFDDLRLDELLFRYRARRWPETLSTEEQLRWDNHIQHQLRQQLARDGGYFARIETLASTATPEQQALLRAVKEYAQTLTSPYADIQVPTAEVK